MGLFELATREKIKMRMALTGVSGAGKTLSSLYIAYGITNDWNKIAVIDTEHSRAKLYANREDLATGQFFHATLTPPYSPDRYKQYVSEAAALVGSDGVVIVDSFSHAWNNEGGILDIKDKISSQHGKTSYTAWGEAGKQQSNLVNTILSVNCHTIVTMRSKMDYILVENDKGRQVPQKVGLAPIQREDTEYEFDIVLDIARNHIATASKDTTFLDKFGKIITPELGQELIEWLNSGEDPEICEICGEIIRATSINTVSAIVKGTIQATGKKLCVECYKKRVEELKVNKQTENTIDSAEVS